MQQSALTVFKFANAIIAIAADDEEVKIFVVLVAADHAEEVVLRSPGGARRHLNDGVTDDRVMRRPDDQVRFQYPHLVFAVKIARVSLGVGLAIPARIIFGKIVNEDRFAACRFTLTSSKENNQKDIES